MPKKKEIYLKTDITIAFSLSCQVTIGIPIEMEEYLELEYGDWIAIRKVPKEEVQKAELENSFSMKGLLPDGD